MNAYGSASSKLKDWLEENGIIRTHRADEVLIREGIVSKNVIILLNGKIAVNTTDNDGNQQCLAVLSDGSIVGEMSWLEKRPAVADIVTQQESTVLCLSFDLLDDFRRSKPSLSSEWQQIIAQKLAVQIQNQNAWIHRYEGPGADIEPLRKVLTLFSELDDQDIDTLSKIGSLRRIQPSGILLKQGQVVTSIYLVLAGEAEIFVEINGITKQVGSSRRGELLGELTLLNKAAMGATATVQSVCGMELLELDKMLLDQELVANPAFANRFFQSLSCMMSQRSRDQLLARQLASRSQSAERSDDGDELDMSQLASINRAGHRFNTLCQKFQSGLGSKK